MLVESDLRGAVIDSHSQGFLYYNCEGGSGPPDIRATRQEELSWCRQPNSNRLVPN